MFGGFISVSNGGYRGDDVFEWDGVQWSGPKYGPMPAFGGVEYAFDTKRGELVQYGGYAGQTISNATWIWNGSWRTLAPSGTPPLLQAAIAYDPIRDATVMSILDGGTWLLH